MTATRKLFRLLLAAIIPMLLADAAWAQASSKQFTKADTLRGSNGPGRNWWNVLHYDITVEPDYLQKTLQGEVIIQIETVNKEKSADLFQIDLQEPMQLDSVWVDQTPVSFTRQGNAWFLQHNWKWPGGKHQIRCTYHGKPREAKRAPWDGGWIWTKDKKGNPWMTVACQGLGASVWYPCKDIQSDEPDQGAMLRIIVPDSLQAIGNGRLLHTVKLANTRTRYEWQVKNPINNYNIVPYIGKYTSIDDTYMGLSGPLSTRFWCLPDNLEKARVQWKDADRMLRAFEYWFGPYPFYEDGFQLVEAPHLGMEHQSAIAYGNKFQNGYLGSDLSGSGWGLKFDFIIIHESGHEWFANSITTNDIADMWVHEGFTNYSEALFTDFHYGKEAGNAYAQGLRRNIDNDIPIIGPYGVNQEGSGDMYPKAANMIHLIRQMMGNDSSFRQMLLGMQKKFYHQTVTSRDVENYMIEFTGLPLQPVFDQYLRTIQVPVLEYRIRSGKLEARWTNTVKDFSLKIPVSFSSGAKRTLHVSTQWKKWKISPLTASDTLQTDPNYYVTVKNSDRDLSAPEKK